MMSSSNKDNETEMKKDSRLNISQVANYYRSSL